MNEEKTLDVSLGTLLKISVLIISFYILYQIKDILVWFLFAAIISIILNPVVNFLKKLKIPRVLGVSFVYICALGVFILLIYFTVPLFISEVQKFSQLLPNYFEKVSPVLKGLGIKIFDDIETFVSVLGGVLEKITANIFNIVFLLFGGIFAAIFILSVSVFLSLEEKWLERTLILFFPEKYEDYASSLARRCQKRVSNWFLIRIIACLFVGVLTYITLLIFKGSYPLSLGILSSVLNFIPVVGPIFMALLLFVIIALDNLFKAVLVIGVFTLVQQVENNILTPFLSKRFVDLSPVLVLLSLAIGGVLWGFLGAILAVPLAAIISEFIRDYLKKKKEEEGEVL
ncbi:MAG: AI-2E family transporter [Patescibacteria group bacterium]